ncbi:MAG: alpha/beta hydrolase, partial [Spirochaetales bacterium]|nr:alpha/beta hydrolase [Spirochaetales bacterium]
MKKFILPFIVVMAMMLVGCPTETNNTDNAPAQPNTDPTTDGMTYWKNYSYNQDHTEDVLDIYRSADEVRPAMMLIHGGAWITVPGFEQQLGRAGMESFKDLFLENGYHVVNIDYRLIKFMGPDGTDYTDMLDDVKSAVQYIYDHASEYKIDTSKIVMYGYSAGAHLAELYSYKVTDSPIPVALCVGRAGPANFWNEKFRTCDVFGGFSGAAGMSSEQLAAAMKIGLSLLLKDMSINGIETAELASVIRVHLIKNLLGITTEYEDVTSDINTIVSNEKAKEDNDSNYISPITAVSPITYVSSSSPRTILLHGKEDKLVDYSIAQDLENELKKCNVKYDFITLD